MAAPPTVLVADDQPDVIAALRLLLRTAGLDAVGAASVDDVRTQLATRDVDVVLMDLNDARDTTSGAEGLELIADLHPTRPHLPLIAMTGWANVDTAVEAMRRGARGYIPNPWNNEAPVQVLARINRALCRQGAHGRFVTLFVAVLDAAEGVIRFCNAGHNPPVLVRGDGAVSRSCVIEAWARASSSSRCSATCTGGPAGGSTTTPRRWRSPSGRKVATRRDVRARTAPSHGRTVCLAGVHGQGLHTPKTHGRPGGHLA